MVISIALGLFASQAWASQTQVSVDDSAFQTSGSWSGGGQHLVDGYATEINQDKWAMTPDNTEFAPDGADFGRNQLAWPGAAPNGNPIAPSSMVNGTADVSGASETLGNANDPYSGGIKLVGNKGNSDGSRRQVVLDDGSLTANVTTETATLLLVGTGLLVTAGIIRRKMKRPA